MEANSSMTEALADRLGIVNASSPGPAAGILQFRPQSRICRKILVRPKVLARRTSRENGLAVAFVDGLSRFSDQIDSGFEAVAVDDDADHVAVKNFADRAPGQG